MHICPYCEEIFIPDPRAKRNGRCTQKTCSRKECKKRLNNEAALAWRKTDRGKSRLSEYREETQEMNEKELIENALKNCDMSLEARVRLTDILSRYKEVPC